MKELWNNLKYAWKYAKDQKGKLILYILSNIIAVTISIIVPILSAKIIISLTSSQLNQVLLFSLVILIIELISNLISYLSKYFSEVIYRETYTKIQNKLGKEILRLENSVLDQSSSGIFIQRLTNDTSKMANIFNILNTCLSSIITNIGIFIAIFIINKIAFCFLLFGTLIIYFLEKKSTETVNAKDKNFRHKNESVSGFVGELVRGSRDIKMLNAETSFLKQFNKKVIDLNQERYSMWRSARNYRLLINCILDFISFGLIFLLVFLIIAEKLLITNALVIYNYMNRVSSMVIYLNMLMEGIKDFNLSSSRIFDIIEGKEYRKEVFGTKHILKVKGDFEFRNVSFGYKENQKVLDNLSFKVNANETVAFVGRSGAGKSTIFSLLCKMYKITEGEITIDGININELDRDTIRGNITIISQNPYIFNLSIRDNLKLVKEDLTEEEMVEACKLACLHNFIQSLPDGYDTLVGEGGINLSGGERQRLAIARAFVQKTEIILFDEATSSLDNETQASIQKAIENLQKEYTILIIAHRLSTVIRSDRILFLSEGRIKAQGTHQELLKKSREYKQLYEAELRDN